MDFSAALSDHLTQNVLKECDTKIPATKQAPSPRTHSCSSSSSFSSCSSSYFPDDSPPSPPTRFDFPAFHFLGTFARNSQETKSKEKDSTLVKVLPLPPHTSKRFNLEEVGIRKKNSNESFGNDPFFTALVECSKGDDDEESVTVSNFWNVTKVSRSISDRV
ncbi:hypothetical protein GH714_023380 [Hevea brasiliensis]|uniref:Uncharacterized protein n=1 Tax=Hevea brasiliensis TaxID=3981 RepID=A0A6A6LBN1_HEVBR|nr:hypothetical protein GH714_023380 [Hevea brasiliensis]